MRLGIGPSVRTLPGRALVKAGNVYTVNVHPGIGLRDGHNLMYGDKLCVVESTLEAPYREVGPAGVNWICAASNGLTVWATLEYCIDAGLFKLSSFLVLP